MMEYTENMTTPNKTYLGARITPENAKWLAMRAIDQSYAERRHISKSEALDMALEWCRKHMPPIKPTE